MARGSEAPWLVSKPPEKLSHDVSCLSSWSIVVFVTNCFLRTIVVKHACFCISFSYGFCLLTLSQNDLKLTWATDRSGKQTWPQNLYHLQTNCQLLCGYISVRDSFPSVKLSNWTCDLRIVIIMFAYVADLFDFMLISSCFEVVNSKPELLACAAHWNPFRSQTFAWVDAGVARRISQHVTCEKWIKTYQQMAWLGHRCSFGDREWSCRVEMDRWVSVHAQKYTKLCFQLFQLSRSPIHWCKTLQDESPDSRCHQIWFQRIATNCTGKERLTMASQAWTITNSGYMCL